MAKGVFAFTLLIALQFIVTWSSVRIRWIRKIVTGEPQMLVENGTFITAVLRRAHVTESEVRAAARAAGLADASGSFFWWGFAQAVAFPTTRRMRSIESSPTVCTSARVQMRYS